MQMTIDSNRKEKKGKERKGKRQRIKEADPTWWALMVSIISLSLNSAPNVIKNGPTCFYTFAFQFIIFFC